MKIGQLSIKFEVIYVLAIFPVSQQVANISELETEYVKHFGSNSTLRHNWETAKLWSYEKDAIRLRKFCASAHSLAGKGEITVEAVVLRQRVLKFVNPKYRPRQILVVAYGIIGNKTKGILERDYWYTREPNHWYMTEGQRTDCVYLLTLHDEKTCQFVLEQNVCNIQIPNNSTTV